MSRVQTIQPVGREVRIRASSTHSMCECRQHAVCPHEPVRPLGNRWGLSGGGSREGHCRRSLVRSFGHSASTFLRPFAPPALPGFLATMDALTPAHGPCLEGASTSSLPGQTTPCPGLASSGVVRLAPPWTSRRDAFSWSGLPVSFVAPSVHSASNHPLPSRCVVWGFPPSGLPSIASLPMRRVLADHASWVSPFPSRLTTATGRIEFAVADHSQPILRTGRSPPVALHPALRRRSYHRLRGSRHPRRGLAPRGYNDITGALGRPS
jgi:hypothetical protein